VKAQLKGFWQSRARWERICAAALLALIGAVSYLWLVHTTNEERTRLRARIAVLQTQAALLEQQAAEHERLRDRPRPADSPSDLRALVQDRAGARSLSKAITRLDAPDAQHVLIVLGSVRFVDWLALLAELEFQQVRVETSRLEALSTPGLVSVTAALTRSNP
jgi:type II secretory pathway component PulM